MPAMTLHADFRNVIHDAITLATKAPKGAPVIIPCGGKKTVRKIKLQAISNTFANFENAGNFTKNRRNYRQNWGRKRLLSVKLCRK